MTGFAGRRLLHMGLLLALLLGLGSCSWVEPLATLVAPTEAPAPSAVPAATSPGSATAAGGASPAATGRATASATAAGGLPAGLKAATPLPGDRLPTIRYEQLPPQAHETLRLLARGGPFPYRQDGVEFQNREGLLPKKAGGYYREYTVETPGSSDRGARRIVAGRAGELFYTADHYASFKRVIP